MKRYGEELKVSQIQMTLLDFLESYNKNMPKSFPLASVQLLKDFKEAHSTLFKNGDSWSLEQHRKKVMDWLPQNVSAI
jgi:hypothetical protein